MFYREFVRLQKLPKDKLVKMLISERANSRALMAELFEFDTEEPEFVFEEEKVIN